jgi:hypothetical protein
MAKILDTFSSSIDYYTRDFWVDNADPFTSQLWGMDTPWMFFMIGLNLILFCKVWGPMVLKNHPKPIDLRATYIIFNGLAFGAYAIGLCAGIHLTNYFSDTFDCKSYNPVTNDLMKICQKYLGYCMIWTKIYDFTIPVFTVLSNRPEKVTLLQLLHLQGAMMLVWVGAKINPGGIFILVALMDTLYQVMVYGYMVMMAASSELRPSDRSFRWFLFGFREVTIVLVFLHQFYFLQKEDCYTKELRFVGTVYVGLTGIFFPIDVYNRMVKNVIPISSRKKQIEMVGKPLKTCFPDMIGNNQNQIIRQRENRGPSRS